MCYPRKRFRYDILSAVGSDSGTLRKQGRAFSVVRMAEGTSMFNSYGRSHNHGECPVESGSKAREAFFFKGEKTGKVTSDGLGGKSVSSLTTGHNESKPAIQLLEKALPNMSFPFQVSSRAAALSS